MASRQPSEYASAFAAEVLLAVEATRPLGEAAALRVDSVHVEAFATAEPGETPPEWTLDMRFRAADGAARADLSGTVDEERESVELPSGGAFFSPRPVAWIQGVDERRAERLAEVGLTTIGALAGVSDDDLAALARKLRLPATVEFRTKALLTHLSVPYLPTSEADRLTLYGLTRLSAGELRDVIGASSFAEPSATALDAYLKLLTVAVDDRILRRVHLGEFRAALADDRAG